MNISVVTPSFNMRAYLARTIDSVLVYLRHRDEYFVIDRWQRRRDLER